MRVPPDMVSIGYEVPGMMITVRGKALESGALGDVINVSNVQTKRTIQATVSGPGRVSVAAMAPRRLAAKSPEQPEKH